MKMSTAMSLVNNVKLTSGKNGFRVSFERREGSILSGDFFPERGESPIESKSEAWELAGLFGSNAPESYVNIYVIDAKTFSPVEDYEKQMLRRYPQRKYIKVIPTTPSAAQIAWAMDWWYALSAEQHADLLKECPALMTEVEVCNLCIKKRTGQSIKTTPSVSRQEVAMNWWHGLSDKQRRSAEKEYPYIMSREDITSFYESWLADPSLKNFSKGEMK